MLIKELSRRTGASVRSIRYYEAKEILNSCRLENGYRDYDDTAVERIKTIQFYLSLGLTTDNIAQIIECPTAPTADRPLCQAAYKLYTAKLNEVNKQLALLQTVQSRLQDRSREFEATANRKKSEAKTMIIDSHAHVMLPPEKQLQLMTAAKIDRTVLFTSTIHPETAATIEGLEQELNRLYSILNGTVNPLQERICAIEELVSIIAASPEKYIGFGSIPSGFSYEENIDWISNYILANNLRGIGELAPLSGQVAQLEPLFQASRETGNLPLWVHAFFPLNFEDIKELLMLAKKYSTVPLILGHLGGVHWLNTLKAVKDIPNVYLDLSATFTTMAPSFAIKLYPERTLFSSDAPYCSPLTARTIIEQIVEDRYVREQVLGGNIARLLNIG